MPVDPLSLDFATKCTCGTQQQHTPVTPLPASTHTGCTCDDCVRMRGGVYLPPSPLIGHRSVMGGMRGSARYPSNRRVAIG